MTDGAPAQFLLFPGRHHVLTRFQAEFLARHAAAGATIVWPVTSANHHTTRRNPVPFHRREAAIERMSAAHGLTSLVVPINDVPPTDDFAQITVKACEVALGIDLSPTTATVACSTPTVAALYAAAGYRILPVEDAVPDNPARPGAPVRRPWQLLEQIAAGDPLWREFADPASVDVLTRYRLDEHIVRVVNDPVIGADGGLTTTRDYRTYAESFEGASDRKWEQISAHVRPGRILDIGCATGALLQRIDADPRFHESDLIGVEVARHLMAECEHKVAQGLFTNPNVFFHQRNMLGDAIFPPDSIDTSISIALTHEIWSYAPAKDPLSRRQTLLRFCRQIARHTTPDGVWINSDVCGPDEPDRPVRLRLDDSDGCNPNDTSELGDLDAPAVTELVTGLSTRARFFQFVRDFAANAGVRIEYRRDGDDVVLRLADAMDFLTRKDYVENWLSESHEQFCGLSWQQWQQLLGEAGLELLPGSASWRNDWIIDNRIAPVAQLHGLDGAELDWPVTHLLAVAGPAPSHGTS